MSHTLIMRRSLLLIFAIVLFSSLDLYSQKPYEVGVFTGFGLYQGDMTEDLIEYDRSKWAKGLFFRFNLTGHFTIRAGYNTVVLNASDAGSRSRKERGWSFEADVNEFYALGEWYFEKRRKRSRYSGPSSIFNLYFFGGLSYTRVDAILRFPDEGIDNYPDPDNRDNFLVVPFGFGMKGELSKRIFLGVEYGWRATFSDYIDDVSQSAKKRNDWYSFAGVNLSFGLNKPKKR